MKETEVMGLFAVAGIEVLRREALIDGYGYQASDPRLFEHPLRCVWWFIKTKYGWVKIGWRKRVISIEWEDTPIRKIITSDDVTKDQTYVHAWSEEDALKYLKALSCEFSKLSTSTNK